MQAPARCRVCGCTDEQACPGGCSWIEPDLCSKCIGARQPQNLDGVISTQELAVTEAIKQGVLMVCQRAGDTGVPVGVMVNGVVSGLARLVAAAHVQMGEPLWEQKFETVSAEAARRLFDAAFSIEDMLRDQAPWAPQSSTVRATEPEGGGTGIIKQGAAVN